MTPRQIRRAADRKARKAARKTGFVNVPSDATLTAPQNEDPQPSQPDIDLGPLVPLGIPEPGIPFPSLTCITPARLNASRENGRQSHGPLTPETKAISAQNHTTHGLARHHNANFKILICENSAAFEALTQSLIDEYKPSTPTESILVKTMAQSHWLADRAQRLQDLCIDPVTGAVTDVPKFSLYMRYLSTHQRTFHKCLNDLTKLRSEKRKAELGFEAQKVATEKHEMKKQSLYWEILKKDALACQELSKLAAQNTDAGLAHPGFEAQYDAELAKRGLTKNIWQAASKAAA